MLMLTGDNTPTARAIAAQVGIDEARGDQLPEDKLAAIESKLSPAGKVGMVGDGINDAPALARADIGFAMGAAGTGTAIETADVALMDDDLRKIGVFLRLSRATHSVLVQNIALALGIKAVFLALAMTGNATLWMAVFADVGASLLVVANGLRLLRAAPPRAKTDHRSVDRQIRGPETATPVPKEHRTWRFSLLSDRQRQQYSSIARPAPAPPARKERSSRLPAPAHTLLGAPQARWRQ